MSPYSEEASSSQNFPRRIQHIQQLSSLSPHKNLVRIGLPVCELFFEQPHIANEGIIIQAVVSFTSILLNTGGALVSTGVRFWDSPVIPKTVK